MTETLSRLETRDLDLAYDQQLIVSQLSLEIPQGKISSLVGANGSGKSTVLKALARVMKPRGGAAYLDGKAIHTQPTKQVARQLAILPQAPMAPDGLTVQELVSYGRYPYQSGFGTMNETDARIIDWALSATRMKDFRERPVGELSGGQRQRAWIAMALAQSTPVLLLDEPTTYLDIGYQLEVMELIERLNRQRSMTILLVLHDLNQAARYSDRMIVLKDGAIVADGAPSDVLTPWLLEEVFHVHANIVTDPGSESPVCLPYRTAGPREPDANARSNLAGHTNLNKVM
jgi:iron complex transport system ATP-binding protein